MSSYNSDGGFHDHEKNTLCPFYATVFATVQSARAALGESADSITFDHKSVLAVQGAITALNGYPNHTIESDATTVREYISPTGFVFGSAWNGLIHPDLTPLLGTCAVEYQEVLRQTPRKLVRRRLQVKTNHITASLHIFDRRVSTAT